MFPGNPVAFNPFAPPAFPMPFMAQPTNQYANPFAQPQAVNPWLVLAWLNQFNPYANAFAQPAPQQFSWQNFWNASPNAGFPAMANTPANTPSFGNAFVPNFMPFPSSQGFFGTSSFHTTAPAPQQPAVNSTVPSYPNFPGVPSFFTNPQPLTNPLDEHAPPKRTSRNGV